MIMPLATQTQEQSPAPNAGVQPATNTMPLAKQTQEAASSAPVNPAGQPLVAPYQSTIPTAGFTGGMGGPARGRAEDVSRQTANMQSTATAAGLSGGEASRQKAAAVQSGAWAPTTPPSQGQTAQAAGSAGKAAATQKAEALGSVQPQRAPAPIAAPTIEIDPNDPNAEQSVKLAREQAHIQRVLQQFDLKAQADIDNYTQRLSERGLSGGAYNAMQMMLMRDQSMRRNDLHYNLERDYLQMLDADKQLEQQSYAHQFNMLVQQGNVDAALKFATEMAREYPDSDFWRQYASNPAMREILAESMQPAVQQRKLQMEQYSRTRLLQSVAGRWDDPNAVAGAWPEFLANEMQTYSRPEAAQIEASAWASANEADALRLLAENTGMDFTGMLDVVPQDVLTEAYVRSRFEAAVQTLRKNDFTEKAMSGAVNLGAGAEDLKMVEDLSGILALTDGNSRIDGLLVNNSAFSDLAGGPLSYLFTDWDGRSYGDDYPRPEAGTQFYALNEAWKVAIGSGMADTITRQAFRDTFEDAAIELGLDAQVRRGQVTPQQIQQILQQSTSSREQIAQQAIPPDVQMRQAMASGQMPVTAASLGQATMAMNDAEKNQYFAELASQGKIQPIPQMGSAQDAITQIANSGISSNYYYVNNPNNMKSYARLIDPSKNLVEIAPILGYDSQFGVVEIRPQYVHRNSRQGDISGDLVLDYYSPGSSVPIHSVTHTGIRPEQMPVNPHPAHTTMRDINAGGN